ncbi:MAG: hypothetical protein KBS96_01475 [Lachnospiraceae bacterium]|nr:hypothetical protein [Candidatus Colinaster scatohippi]
MMNRELEFAKKIEELRILAKDQGNVLSKEQIEDMFASIDMTPDMLGPVYEYLKTKKIGIGEPVDVDELLSEDDRNYLEIYLEELAELNEYTDGEKEAYFISAMAGHKESQKRVIEIMLPDVVDMAKLYTDQGVTLEDLIGEGNVALAMGVTMLGALESGKEVPEALAQIIMNSMESFIEEESDIKSADNKIVSKVNKVAEAAASLAEALGRKVTVEELKEETGFSKKLILDAIKFSGSKIEDIEV